MSDSSQIGHLTAQARSAANRGDNGEAVRLLERALELVPDLPERLVPALDLLGFVLFFQGDVHRALEMCERSIALSPRNAYAHQAMGMCLERLGKVDEGIACLRRSVQLEPTRSDAYWDLAIVLSRAGRREEALKTVALARERLAQPSDALRRLERELRVTNQDATKR